MGETSTVGITGGEITRGDTIRVGVRRPASARSLRAVAVLLGLALAFYAPRAHAAPSKRVQAKRQFEQAEKYYKVGDFQKAADHYAKAYGLVPLSPLLFNLAQCQKQLGNCERAVFYYETYLRENPNAPNAQLAADLLEECRQTLKAAQEAKAPASATPDAKVALGAAAEDEAGIAIAQPVGGLPDNTTIVGSGVATSTVSPQPGIGVGMPLGGAPPEPHQESVLKRWWFWGIVTGAVLAAGGGTYLYVSRPKAGTVPPSGSLGYVDARTH